MINTRVILPTLRIQQARLMSTLRGLVEVRDQRIVVGAPCLVMMQARFSMQLIAN